MMPSRPDYGKCMCGRPLIRGPQAELGSINDSYDSVAHGAPRCPIGHELSIPKAAARPL